MENRILKNKMCNKNKILLEKYISVFENLKEDNLDGLKELISLDVYFEDPFQKTQGRNEYIKIFKDMFLKLDKPTFKVLDYSISENSNNNCFMKWILRGKLKNNNRNNYNRASSYTPVAKHSIDYEGEKYIECGREGHYIEYKNKKGNLIRKHTFKKDEPIKKFSAILKVAC